MFFFYVERSPSQDDWPIFVKQLAHFKVGVALVCPGVELFEVGVACATPKVYKYLPLGQRRIVPYQTKRVLFRLKWGGGAPSACEDLALA